MKNPPKWPQTIVDALAGPGPFRLHDKGCCCVDCIWAEQQKKKGAS